MESEALELVTQNEETLKCVFIFVGEGNFSFSATLAKSPNFHNLHSSLIASDYIPELADELRNCEVQIPDWNEENGRNFAENKNTSLIKENVAVLKSLQHRVFFDVNATRIHEHEEVLEAVKDFTKILIIFNFPHVKCKKMKIGLNRDLLREFFVSCDNFTRCLRRTRTCNKPVEVIPVVSLCAGQSGIPDVEVVTKPRCWGDSWQINDMAAHGNFVCVKVCKFEDWDIFTTGKSLEGESLQGYHSSYFRLQSGVSFSTTDALTFTYQQRLPIDTQESNRLQSMMLFAGNKYMETFHPIMEEGIIPISQDFKDYNNGDSDKRLPYIHFVKCTGGIQQVYQYLNFDLHSESLIVNADNQICLNLHGKESLVVGEIEDENLILYVNYLVELKYKCKFREVMGLSFGEENVLRSLYPRTHEFHISFWINESFTMQKFIEVILDVYGLMLNSLQFLEEFTNEKNRMSICWRIQVEALEFALSREAAHQLYLTFRYELANRLDLDVR